MKSKRYEMRFAGAGGQGVILCSIILAQAAFLAGKRVAQSQSYGPEARGSLCQAELIIDEGRIVYPNYEKLGKVIESVKIISKDGKDKIFLIDEKSLLKYRDAYNKKHEKIYGVDLLSSIGTNYARHKGLPVSNNNDEYYYHGSYMIDNNKIVDYFGNIMDLDNSLDIDNFKCGMRPAIWVKKG